MNMKQTVDYLVQAVESQRTHRIVTGNPIMLMAGLEDAGFHRALRTADLVVPDGAGVVWAARHVGQPVPERVAGFDLMHELLREGDRRHWKVYLLGTTQEIISSAHEKLSRQFPGVRFVGYRDGYFTDREDGAVIAAIREAKPDLLFVARSLMTQEPWLEKYQDALQVPVMMGVGGSFDVVAGKLKRAPAIFRKLGLEWFYRLLQEPSRLPRMLVLPRFALKVMKDGEKVLKPSNPS
ncbi:WecB/TagA/CpsF family glycosyltransferase [Cohnella pontilimi]|uniref:WecB/TagA/CpsF family glycosyltransferase n=1 Tax=Cohnella pontilimi TaxID=2564100 RepID=A0A4U0FB43_9BACL|nr:WecB/TagA/CpsF family glycosyltransferase [Cohnella pontilimi]TJY42036.1 WecB/TagA/CpsF family glycosyltransferase [Cohnella pontilimi]